MERLNPYCVEQRRVHHCYAVVNPGNALCASTFSTKREAEEWRRGHASAYVVVPAIVTPDYRRVGLRLWAPADGAPDELLDGLRRQVAEARAILEEFSCGDSTCGGRCGDAQRFLEQKAGA